MRLQARDYLEAILVALVIGMVLRVFVVQAYRIPSESMQNTLFPGDCLLVSKVHYSFSEPKTGDIVVFQFQMNPEKDYVKRCIAVEGQTVEVRDKVVYVNGQPSPVPEEVMFIDSKILPKDLSNRDNFGPVVVLPGHIFVMGDNRDNSRDSREWGFLDKELIRGKAMFVYWSVEPSTPNTPALRALANDLINIRWDRIGYDLSVYEDGIAHASGKEADR